MWNLLTFYGSLHLHIHRPLDNPKLELPVTDPGVRFTNESSIIKFTIVSLARMRAFHQSIRKRSTYDFRVTST